MNNHRPTYTDLVNASIINPSQLSESFVQDGKKYTFAYLTGGTSGCAVYTQKGIPIDGQEEVMNEGSIVKVVEPLWRRLSKMLWGGAE